MSTARPIVIAKTVPPVTTSMGRAPVKLGTRAPTAVLVRYVVSRSFLCSVSTVGFSSVSSSALVVRSYGI